MRLDSGIVKHRDFSFMTAAFTTCYTFRHDNDVYMVTGFQVISYGRTAAEQFVVGMCCNGEDV
jgi:hypothetical protein